MLISPSVPTEKPNNLLSSVIKNIKPRDSETPPVCVGQTFQTQHALQCSTHLSLFWKWYWPIGTSWKRNHNQSATDTGAAGHCANVRKRRGHRACTNSCVDLAIVCGQAVPLVQVGEGLGGTPGLQVAGHPDRRPHLAAVQGRAGAKAQQGAVTLRLPEHKQRQGGFEQDLLCWLEDTQRSTF